MIADAKTADGSQTFAECADNKIHPVFHSGFLGQSSSICAQNTQRMGFIHQQICTVFLLDGDYLRQRCTISKHAVEAFDHNQYIGISFFKPPQSLFEILRVVVPKTMHLGAPHTTAVIYAGMTVGI